MDPETSDIVNLLRAAYPPEDTPMFGAPVDTSLAKEAKETKESAGLQLQPQEALDALMKSELEFERLAAQQAVEQAPIPQKASQPVDAEKKTAAVFPLPKMVIVRNTLDSGVTDFEAQCMSDAVNALLGELGGVWGRVVPNVAFRKDAPPGEKTYTLTIGKVASPEIAVDCQARGSKLHVLLDTSNPSGPTIAKRLFRTIVDDVMNPTRAHPIDLWTPVEDSSVPLEVNYGADDWVRVSLCNYLYPAWWDGTALGKLDRAGVLFRCRVRDCT